MNQKLKFTNRRSEKIPPLLVILFFGSGCAALIYEVVWYQMLQLVIGVSSLSLGLLLATFMGGMSLGSVLLPRLVSMRHNPMLVYAYLELGIGLFAIVLLFGMPFVHNLYTDIAGYGLFRSVLLRSVIAVICLLPPTILMGATLPAISRWVESTINGVSWMGFFYGGNIFGGVAGGLLAGFYLLRIYNISTATYVSVFINITVALTAVVISRNGTYKSSHSGSTLSLVPDKKIKVAHFAIALSGMAALGSEVIWTRLLSATLGPTVYTFSIILAVFLFGLGIGSSAGAYLGRFLKHPGFALGMCQFLLILTISWTSYIIARYIPFVPLDPTTATNPWKIFGLDLALSAMAILPSALFWGASFPLALATVVSRDQDPGKMVGKVYAFNTIGAIIGSLVFSMIGIPVFGSALSQKIIIMISAASAMLMFYHAMQTANKIKANASHVMKFLFKNRITLVSLFVILIAVLFMNSIHNLPWTAIAFGRSSNIVNYNLYPEKPSKQIAEMTPIYVGEGLNESVVVTEHISGIRSFCTAGKVQASTNMLDMRLQRMLGHISTLFVDKPESVLVVACGAGITAGTFVSYPEVESVVVCEIEALVPKKVAPLFSDENNGIADSVYIKNPCFINGKEVRFEFDDGRHYISTTDNKFDIITCDVDPYTKGAAALYTKEYFEICKAHLKPGGAMTQYVPLFMNSLESIKSLISTFFSVFPNGSVWGNFQLEGIDDLVLLGTVEESHIDIDKLEKRLNANDYALVRKSLAEVGFSGLEDLLLTFTSQAKDMKDWMVDAQINTDRDLRLGYLAGMAYNLREGELIGKSIREYYKFPYEMIRGSEEKIRSLEMGLNLNLLGISK